MSSIRRSCPILMEREFSRQFFEKYSNVEFNKNPSSGSRVFSMLTGGRAYRNFANAPKNLCIRVPYKKLGVAQQVIFYGSLT
jgi:hypothetical protein